MSHSEEVDEKLGVSKADFELGNRIFGIFMVICMAGAMIVVLGQREATPTWQLVTAGILVVVSSYAYWLWRGRSDAAPGALFCGLGLIAYAIFR